MLCDNSPLSKEEIRSFVGNTPPGGYAKLKDCIRRSQNGETVIIPQCKLPFQIYPRHLRHKSRFGRTKDISYICDSVRLNRDYFSKDEEEYLHCRLEDAKSLMKENAMPIITRLLKRIDFDILVDGYLKEINSGAHVYLIELIIAGEDIEILKDYYNEIGEKIQDIINEIDTDTLNFL